MTTLLALLLVFGFGQQAAPPDTVTLQYCYRQAEEHYPLAKNIELQERITELNMKIASTGHYPRLNVNGKASYQSEVTDFSLPGGAGPPGVSKDQYEASLSMTQNIFNGGAVGIREQLEQAKGRQQVNSIEVDLHKIRSQIDQVYYGILLSQKQGKTNELLIKDLRERLKTVRSQVSNGILLPSQQKILEAELIKAKQDSAEIRSNVKAGYQVLAELIGEDLATDTALKLPQLNINMDRMQAQRPEYDLFRSNRETIKQQQELAGTQKWPTISAFGTASYGRPGLNFLSDDFHDYYIVGLRLRWNFWDSRNASREQQTLEMQRKQITQNERAFTTQLQATLDRIRERVATLRENIERDKKIVALRRQVVDESASQLENGAITATEYVTELTRAQQAELSLLINRVRLVQAQTEYATTLGVPLEAVQQN